MVKKISSPDAATGKTTATENLINYLMKIDSRPSYVNEDTFDFEDGFDYLDIVMFGGYHIKLHYDPFYSASDVASAPDGGGYGKYDLEYASDIMYRRDRIIALAKEAGLNSKDIVCGVVDKIREYVKNYNGPMVNYYGLSEFIYMRWDNFTEDEKEYVMDHEFIVKNNTEYYLKKDNIIVKEMLVEENGIVVYVEW
jgi:hypothetical protein